MECTYNCFNTVFNITLQLKKKRDAPWNDESPVQSPLSVESNESDATPAMETQAKRPRTSAVGALNSISKVTILRLVLS